MSETCKTCDRLLFDAEKGCQHCRRQKIHQSPWAQQDDGFLKVSNLFGFLEAQTVADRMKVEKRSVQRWGERNRRWTIEQACAAATMLRVDPYMVWPELDTNVPAPPARWWERARCGPRDQWLFHPDAGGSAALYDRARVICSACPVRNACLWDCLRWEDAGARHGMYGGMTPKERRRFAQGLFDWRPRARIA